MDRISYAEKAHVRSRFKAPEGRYGMLSEKTTGVLPFNHQRCTRLTVATLQGGPEEGVWVIYNVSDTLNIARHESTHKDPARSLLMCNMPSRTGYPTCHAYQSAKDGIDLLVGLADGDVHLLSLRAQLQAQHSAKPIIVSTLSPEGTGDPSRCTAVAWIPRSENGSFVAAFASGAIFVFKKTTVTGESTSKFSLTISGSKSSNPAQTYNVPGGGINDLTVSPDGSKAAIACRDGVVRLVDISNGSILLGFQTYYGAALCCAFTPDSRYIASGGEDDLIAVYGIQEKAFVAHCEGHTSWISRIQFDAWLRVGEMSSSMTELASTSRTYRMGSVGQDAAMCLWDLIISQDGDASAAAAAAGGPPISRRFGSQQQLGSVTKPAAEAPAKEGGKTPKSSIGSVGPIHPSPSRADMLIQQPIMQHRLHLEPMSDLLFLEDMVLTADHCGCIKAWHRPQQGT